VRGGFRNRGGRACLVISGKEDLACSVVWIFVFFVALGIHVR